MLSKRDAELIARMKLVALRANLPGILDAQLKQHSNATATADGISIAWSARPFTLSLTRTPVKLCLVIICVLSWIYGLGVLLEAMERGTPREFSRFVRYRVLEIEDARDPADIVTVASFGLVLDGCIQQPKRSYTEGAFTAVEYKANLNANGHFYWIGAPPTREDSIVEYEISESQDGLQWSLVSIYRTKETDPLSAEMLDGTKVVDLRPSFFEIGDIANNLWVAFASMFVLLLAVIGKPVGARLLMTVGLCMLILGEAATAPWGELCGPDAHSILCVGLVTELLALSLLPLAIGFDVLIWKWFDVFSVYGVFQTITKIPRVRIHLNTPTLSSNFTSYPPIEPSTLNLRPRTIPRHGVVHTKDCALVNFSAREFISNQLKAHEIRKADCSAPQLFISSVSKPS